VARVVGKGGPVVYWYLLVGAVIGFILIVAFVTLMVLQLSEKHWQQYGPYPESRFRVDDRR
jgi:hypothetical protein